MARTKFSMTTLEVLRAFLEKPTGQLYGLQLIQTTGVKAGALYPILSRLEADGLIAGEWEAIDEAAEGRRRRRYYRLTALGEQTAIAALSAAVRRLSPPRAGMVPT